jgi:hypothetical protein
MKAEEIISASNVIARNSLKISMLRTFLLLYPRVLKCGYRSSLNNTVFFFLNFFFVFAVAARLCEGVIALNEDFSAKGYLLFERLIYIS